MEGIEAAPRPLPHSRRITINYLFSAMGALIPIVVSLVVVPLYIHRIGADRYGILALVWVLLGYFGFMDFGLSRASSNALSRLAGEGPTKRVPVLMTALYLNLGLGAFGGLLMYVAGAWMVGHMATLSGPLHGEVHAVLPWVACLLPISLIAGVGTGAIESRERFFVSNLLGGIGGILGQVIPLYCAYRIGPSLTVLVPAALAARLILTVAILSYVFHAEGPVDLRRFDRVQVRPLLGYGAWVSVTGIISPMLETFDQMLIGALLGPAAIAHYSVPMSMATRSQFVASALAKTLFPRLSRVESDHAHELADKAIVTLAYGYAAVCAPAIVVAGPFLSLWIGAGFSNFAAPVAMILLVGAWANGIAFIPFTLLQSRGRPDLVAKIHIGEIIPFLATVWVMTKLFGLPGAALAWALRVIIDLFAMLYFGRLFARPLFALLPVVGLVLGSYAFAQFVRPAGWAAVTIACVIGIATLVGALIWDAVARSMVLNGLRRLHLLR